MNNLMAVAWIHTFSTLVMAGIAFLAFLIAYIKRKPPEKGYVIFATVCLLCTLWRGIPYITDCIFQQTEIVVGTVVDISTATYRRIQTETSYTLETQDQSEITLKLGLEKCSELEMEKGLTYEVTYYSHSKAIKHVEEILDP